MYDTRLFLEKKERKKIVVNEKKMRFVFVPPFDNAREYY